MDGTTIDADASNFDQVGFISTIVFDRKTDSYIISIWSRKRIVRLSRGKGLHARVLVRGIFCHGVTMDNSGNLYICDLRDDAVRRYRAAETDGTLVAGGNGLGSELNQLHGPWAVFVDLKQSVYVADHGNHRVMKWMKNAKEGILVAGGNGPGNQLTQLYDPKDLFADGSGSIYVADSGNDRIICWPKDATEGEAIVGNVGSDGKTDQLQAPERLWLDRQGNLYVVDKQKRRLQFFSIKDSIK